MTKSWLRDSNEKKITLAFDPLQAFLCGGPQALELRKFNLKKITSEFYNKCYLCI